MNPVILSNLQLMSRIMLPPLLAQSADPLDVFMGVLLLVVVLVGGFMALMYFKKWLKEDDEPSSDIGFTLGDLRQLHKNGKMSDEEYEKARTQMIAATKRAAERAALAAAEEAKKRGGVTDIEELRSRSRRVDRPETQKNGEDEGDLGRPENTKE
jgi:hypothetical protein